MSIEVALTLTDTSKVVPCKIAACYLSSVNNISDQKQMEEHMEKTCGYKEFDHQNVLDCTFFWSQLSNRCV